MATRENAEVVTYGLSENQVAAVVHFAGRTRVPIVNAGENHVTIRTK